MFGGCNEHFSHQAKRGTKIRAPAMIEVRYESRHSLKVSLIFENLFDVDFEINT